MDLATIKKRLDNGYYRNAEECLLDFELMFTNCKTYNRHRSWIMTMARKLKKEYQRGLTDMPQIEWELPTTGKSSLPDLINCIY